MFSAFASTSTMRNPGPIRLVHGRFEVVHVGSVRHPPAAGHRAGLALGDTHPDPGRSSLHERRKVAVERGRLGWVEEHHHAEIACRGGRRGSRRRFGRRGGRLARRRGGRRAGARGRSESPQPVVDIGIQAAGQGVSGESAAQPVLRGSGIHRTQQARDDGADDRSGEARGKHPRPHRSTPTERVGKLWISGSTHRGPFCKPRAKPELSRCYPVRDGSIATGPRRRGLGPKWWRTSRSVSRILCPPPRRRAAIIHLRPLLPGAWCDLPGSSGEQPSNASAGATRAPSLDLAPGGVYRATPVAWGAGGLLHHRFTLTSAPIARTGAVCFLWHCPAGRPGWVLPTTLLCGVRTFLSAPSLPCGGRPAIARPTRPPSRLSRCRTRSTMPLT